MSSVSMLTVGRARASRRTSRGPVRIHPDLLVPVIRDRQQISLQICPPPRPPFTAAQSYQSKWAAVASYRFSGRIHCRLRLLASQPFLANSYRTFVGSQFVHPFLSSIAILLLPLVLPFRPLVSLTGNKLKFCSPRPLCCCCAPLRTSDSVWLWKRGRAMGGVWNGWIETPVDSQHKKQCVLSSFVRLL